MLAHGSQGSRVCGPIASLIVSRGLPRKVETLLSQLSVPRVTGLSLSPLSVSLSVPLTQVRKHLSRAGRAGNQNQNQSYDACAIVLQPYVDQLLSTAFTTVARVPCALSARSSFLSPSSVHHGDSQERLSLP